MENDMDNKQIVRNFIIKNLLFDQDDLLDDETSFYNTGLIDSTGMLEVITFIEDKFKIQVNDDELIPDNLSNINNISLFINNKIENRV